MNYNEQLAAVAAHNLRQSAANRQYHGLLARKSRGALRRMSGSPPAPSYTTFPNALGNYRGKRKERPLVAPLAPRERFVRLAAAYMAFASRPRNVLVA